MPLAARRSAASAHRCWPGASRFPTPSRRSARLCAPIAVRSPHRPARAASRRSPRRCPSEVSSRRRAVVTRLPSVLRPLFPWLKAGVVQATQAVHPLTRRLPGSSPPRHTASRTAADVRAHASRRRRDGDGGGRRPGSGPAASGGAARRPPPIRRPPTGAHRRRTSSPPCATDASWLRTAPSSPRTTRSCSTSRPITAWRRPSQHPVYLRRRLPDVSDVHGSVGVLTTRGSENYYHFLTDVLPGSSCCGAPGPHPTRTSSTASHGSSATCSITWG